MKPLIGHSPLPYAKPFRGGWWSRLRGRIGTADWKAGEGFTTIYGAGVTCANCDCERTLRFIWIPGAGGGWLCRPCLSFNYLSCQMSFIAGKPGGGIVGYIQVRKGASSAITPRPM